jgi:Fe2+ or Zn2+ uptake regulation protein
LHARGKRLTPQRRAILDILESSGEHLDAQNIWMRAQERDEHVNLATVYRTLNVLKRMGLVEQRYFAREHKREIYESAAKPEHYHFTCLGCGAVVEFQTHHVMAARRTLEREHGLELSHACVCFEGYCRECVAAQRR